MPRFAFRQVDYRDIDMFLADGEVRSKNHPSAQACHQTSYANLVGLRATPVFQLPHGGVVNDYVAFYFSPFTSFTCTIHRHNVNVVSPTGANLGPSRAEDRAFLVVNIDDVYAAGLPVCFSNYALNTQAPLPTVMANQCDLATHVMWPLFDDHPMTAEIPEIGYRGVCRFFNDTPDRRYQARSKARMAEFLIFGAVPMNLVTCIVTPTFASQSYVQARANQYGFQGQVLQKPGCFVQ